VEEEYSLLQHYERLASARYSSGLGSQHEVIKLQSSLSRLLNRTKTLEQQRRIFASRLNLLRAFPAQRDIPQIAPPRPPQFLAPDVEALSGIGEENREELRSIMAMIERNERSIEVAKKDFWPDFTLGAGFINVAKRQDLAGIVTPPPENGKNAFSFSVGLNIPIWRDKYRSAVLEATENLMAERSSYQAVVNQIEYEVSEAVIRIQTLQEQLDLFAQVLIPQTEQTLKSGEAAYETGHADILDLLDSESALFELRLSDARFRTEIMKALTDLERAVGTKYPE
jgi:outer membrane protein TolC